MLRARSQRDGNKETRTLATPFDESALTVPAAGQTAGPEDGAGSNGSNHRNKSRECLHLEGGGEHDAANDGEKLLSLSGNQLPEANDDIKKNAWVASWNIVPNGPEDTATTRATSLCDTDDHLDLPVFLRSHEMLLNCSTRAYYFCITHLRPYSRDTPKV